MRAELMERVAVFGLTLHEEENTRVIEFGRLPAISSEGTRAAAAGDVRLSEFHALLRVDPRRTIRGEAEDERQHAAARFKALNEEAKRRRRQPVRVQHQ